MPDLDERLFDPGLEEPAAPGCAGPVENIQYGLAGLTGVLHQVQPDQGPVVDPHMLGRPHLLHSAQ